jgi:hypothetical protein
MGGSWRTWKKSIGRSWESREVAGPMNRKAKEEQMSPEIEIVVSKDGTVTVEAKGAVGAGCLDLTRAIEQALGEVESRECKVEFYESVAEGEQLQQREG